MPLTANLHTHGLHVSPLGDSDNVILEILPGESNRYQIQIPANHAEGLYWYHPHFHGTVNSEISRGLSGLLVIGKGNGGAPELDPYPHYLMGIKNALLQGNRIVDPQEVQGNNFKPADQTYTVNGQLNPVLTVKAGQTQVFNLANIGNDGFFAMSLVDHTGVEQNLVQLIAEDGNPFTQAGNPGGAPTMPPGRRWTWAFTPPPNAVSGWKLRLDDVNDGTHVWPGTVIPVDLLTINFVGSQPADPPLGTLTPPNSFYHDLRSLPVDVQRMVVFGETVSPGGSLMTTINGAMFPNNPVFQPRLNSLEEWILVNPTVDDHPFHLHVDPQQVSKSGRGNNPSGLPQFQDVINVPFAEGGVGTTVNIRVQFFDYLGTFVYHCHRVDHEDAGMMALVEVLPQQSILVTGAGAGGGPQVNVFNGDTNEILAQFNAFNPGFTGGVQVAVGDVNNDGISDVLCGAGPGGGPQVRVLSGADFSELYSFFAFDPAFTGGVNIAAGDINSDGYDDMICGAGAGGGPQVAVYSGFDGTLLHSFYAYDSAFTGGVNVAAADLVGNGRIYLVTGAGAGGGPQVRVFDDHIQPVASFFAFDSGFTGGVHVATGRVRGIGFDSLICGAGAGGGPTVNTYQALSIHEPGDHAEESLSFSLISSWSAFAPDFTGGVRVGSFNKTLGTDYLVGAGAGGGPQATLLDGVTHDVIDSFFAYSPAFTGGVFVAAN